MTDTPHYLDGFRAAVSPGQGRAASIAPMESRPLPAALPAPSQTGPVSVENLSAEELIKRRLHPLDSFMRLLECAELDRPPGPDDRFRFQWFGLFYQAPRQDAFLLRLRLPGGWLETFQLGALASITQELASGHLLLNPQGGLDIPGVPLRAAAEILRQTEGIGLSARQTGGDCVQCIQGIEIDEPMAGNPRALVHPLIGRLEQALMHNRTLADLPRGCQIVFQREDQPPASSPEDELDTIVLQVVSASPSHPDNGTGANGAPRFLLVVPGNPEGGFSLAASRVVSGCLKLLEAWAARADRANRQRVGLGAFCGALGRENVSALLDNAPWQPRPTPSRANSSVPGGIRPPGFAVPGGRLLSGQMVLIEQIVREHGLGGVRLVRGQLYIMETVDSAARDALNLALAWEQSR